MFGGKKSTVIAHLWEPGGEMRSRTRMCAELTLEPGASIGDHRHSGEEEIYYIISGRAEVTDNGETRVLEAGDAMLTGDDNSHAIANPGPETLRVLAVVARH